MAITPFLAMTAAEYLGCSSLPPQVAWMACHFSPYSTGLSNLPNSLPAGSVLMVNDSTPVLTHDPDRIAFQLTECVDRNGCSAVLLDFQRKPTEETLKLTAHLLQALRCPVVVSSLLADKFSCPVFLPPCPLHTPLKEHLLPWAGREIWLEAAIDSETVILAEKGASFFPLCRNSIPGRGLRDDSLHIHYHIYVEADSAEFTLWQTMEDLDALLSEAKEYGVSAAVGLYQQLQPENQKHRPAQA